MIEKSDDAVRERAYEIWTVHGCVHGQANQHWLAAEREILATSTATLAREPALQRKRRSPVRSRAVKTLAPASLMPHSTRGAASYSARAAPTGKR